MMINRTASAAVGFGRFGLAAFGALAGSVVFAACAGDSTTNGGAGAEWEATTTTDGNVTTVRTLSGSDWGGMARLVEDASIGVEQGDAPYMLGRVGGIAAYERRIYVLDTSVPVVRAYDFDGSHLFDIGAEGDGPGEFRRPEDMVIGPDGRLYVRDGSQGRITVFDPEGGLLDTWRLDAGFVIQGPRMVVTHDGTVYNPGMANPEAGFDNIIIGMIPRGPEGSAGDPIIPPEIDYEPPRLLIEIRRGDNVMMRMERVPFAPDSMWAMSPSGAMVSGLSTEYRVGIHYPDGTTTVVVKDWEPVSVVPDEAAWHKKRVTAEMRSTAEDWVWDGPEIPSTKPAFDFLSADYSGRVWVWRPEAGIRAPDCDEDMEPGADISVPCWRDPVFADVFDLEGRFLGEVDVPEDIGRPSLSYVRGDMMLAYVEDELGTPMVKRYRIELPE